MPLQYIPLKPLDNLFSANHRNAMIARYGYTDAMRMAVDDALYEATMGTVITESHDCHRSEMDSCKGCEEIQAALEDLK